MKPPYTKWINDIKTKLGFNRTMTASGEDVVDAVNEQSQQIDDLGPYNGLDSDSIIAALSAAQGKALKQLIDSMMTTTNALTSDDRVLMRRCINVASVTVWGTTFENANTGLITSLIPAEYRPDSKQVSVLSKIYNGSDYVDCILALTLSGELYVRNLTGGGITGADLRYIQNPTITFIKTNAI